MKHVEKFCVNSHDADFNGIVRPSVMLRYIQETANLQHYKYGPTTAELRADNKAFILSRVAMNLYRPLHEFENIEAESWLCNTHGFSFLRCGRILRDGVVIAELSSIWALVAIDSRKLLKADDIKLNFTVDEPLQINAPTRIKIPRNIDMVLMGERTVGYSDIDCNGHMNNTNYPDMLCNFLPDMNGRRVVSFSISFGSEARIGETFKVYCGENDGVYYFRTVKSDGNTGVEAEMTIDLPD